MEVTPRGAVYCQLVKYGRGAYDQFNVGVGIGTENQFYPGVGIGTEKLHFVNRKCLNLRIKLKQTC